MNRWIRERYYQYTGPLTVVPAALQVVVLVVIMISRSAVQDAGSGTQIKVLIFTLCPSVPLYAIFDAKFAAIAHPDE